MDLIAVVFCIVLLYLVCIQVCAAVFLYCYRIFGEWRLIWYHVGRSAVPSVTFPWWVPLRLRASSAVWGASLWRAAGRPNYCRRALVSTGVPTQARAVQQDDADVPQKLQLTYSFRISQSPSSLTTFRPEREKILRSDKFRPRYDEKIARVHVFMRAWRVSDPAQCTAY